MFYFPFAERTDIILFTCFLIFLLFWIEFSLFDTWPFYNDHFNHGITYGSWHRSIYDCRNIHYFKIFLRSTVIARKLWHLLTTGHLLPMFSFLVTISKSWTKKIKISLQLQILKPIINVIKIKDKFFKFFFLYFI